MDETLREVIKRRDGIDDGEFDAMLDEFGELISDGWDPKEALLDVFGIEPDFLMDDEIMKVMS